MKKDRTDQGGEGEVFGPRLLQGEMSAKLCAESMQKTCHESLFYDKLKKSMLGEDIYEMSILQCSGYKSH